MPRLPLSRLNHEHAMTVIDAVSGSEVLHAPTAHSLIQAAGYLKHTRAKNLRKGVFFRGQTELYPTLSPALLRGVKDGVNSVRRRGDLTTLLEAIRTEGKALKAVDHHCQEALLQHYGIRTTWIDVVDNVWVALWFACHDARVAARGGEEYLHFERRIPAYIGKPEPDYAYILLLEAAYFDCVEDHPGHYRDASSETIDLRIAVPSQFVRPHAQHGLLVRKLSNTGQPVSDCAALHVGTIRVELAAALDWMGSADTLTSHALFPPAYYDYGYRELLEFVRPATSRLGSIHRVGP